MTKENKGTQMSKTHPPSVEGGKRYLHATMHEFKTHIAAYMRALEAGRADGIVLKRYHKPVGILFPMPKRD